MPDKPAYLKIRCPNKPTADSTFECRGNMGGFSIEFLKSPSSYPIKDLRYCHRCGAFVEVEIDSPNSQPKFRVLSPTEKGEVNFVLVEDFFGGYSVEGRLVAEKGEIHA